MTHYTPSDARPAPITRLHRPLPAGWWILPVVVATASLVVVAIVHWWALWPARAACALILLCALLRAMAQCAAGRTVRESWGDE